MLVRDLFDRENLLPSGLAVLLVLVGLLGYVGEAGAPLWNGLALALGIGWLLWIAVEVLRSGRPRPPSSR